MEELSVITALVHTSRSKQMKTAQQGRLAGQDDPNNNAKNGADADGLLSSSSSSSQPDPFAMARISRRRTSCLWTVFVITFLLGCGYFLRDYVHKILIAVEDQDDGAVLAILSVLYFLVSLPVAWGYIVINIATGYLYGVVYGLLVTMATATLGIFSAHLFMRAFCVKHINRWLVSTNTMSQSLNLVLSSSASSFRLIVMLRLTPVPFGLQNALFAANLSVSTSRYLLATCLGLLPCQIINVYIGSTFRSMEQVLSGSDQTARLGLLLLGLQVVVAACVTYFVVQKAKLELVDAMNKTVSGSLESRALLAAPAAAMSAADGGLEGVVISKS